MRKAESNWDQRRIDDTFPYLRILMQGRPECGGALPGHPAMDREHRAKIFAPFDALDGFSALIRQKDRLHNEAVPEKTEENICVPWGNP